MDMDTKPRSLLRTIVTDPAHLLSLVRIPLALLVWWRPADILFVAVVVAVAGISDFLDGVVGRRRHHPTAIGTANIGAWLDPVCDKVFVLSTATVVVVTHGVGLGVLALVLVRDIATAVLTVAFRLLAGAKAFHRHDFRARWSGKVTMAAQLLTVLAIVLWPTAVLPMAAMTGALGLVAVGHRVLLVWRDREPSTATTLSTVTPASTLHTVGGPRRGRNHGQ